MRENPTNTNPWAEKLEQVSLPDTAEAKEKMLALLNRELPLPPKKNQWGFLQILLLLLLNGVYHCPPRQGSSQQPVAQAPAAPGSYHAATVKKPGIIKIPAEGNLARNGPLPGNEPVTAYNNNKNGYSTYTDIVPGQRSASLHHRRDGISPAGPVRKGNKKRGNNAAGITAETDAVSDGAGSRKQKHLFEPGGIDPAIPPSATGMAVGRDTVNRQTAGVKRNDTTHIKMIVTEDSVAKKTEEETSGRLSFAIGFNQAIPLGGQQTIGRASGNNIWSDYVPVPQLQYHFNDKWYVQFEAAIHSPQYTSPLLLRSQGDSVAGGTMLQSVYLKKLFYLQFPLSVHYSPFKNCYAGAGIRVGFIDNALALFDGRRMGVGQPDTILYSKIQSLKNDSASLYKQLKDLDLQWFADISYHWKKLSGGLRYNNSFGPYINMKLPGGTNAKATNHSLQLYLRYMLWQQSPKKSAVK